MIGLIIDIVLIAIVVFCAWRGFRAGLITSIIGVVAVVVAIYGANLIAATYSGEPVKYVLEWHPGGTGFFFIVH